jgi:5'-3' exonuclease
MNGEELVLFYPEEFEWIAWEKVMLYSVEPKLPLLDIQLIRLVVMRNNDKFTEEEKRRNLVR